MFTHGEGYDRFMGRWSLLLARRFVAFAKLEHATSVLDVGCGTGALAAALVDPSSAFVERARARVGTATFAVSRAEQLPFPDARFDAACACLVLNFVADQRAALAQMRRVVRPGGTIATAVWDHAQGMAMLKTFWDVAETLDPGLQATQEPQPLLDLESLKRLWSSADLQEIVTEPLIIDMPFADFNDYWQPFALGQGPAGLYVTGASPKVRSNIEAELRSRLIPGGDGPFTLTARAWGIRGHRPLGS